MANITGAQNERVFTIQKWLGLNQNPDGDTKLKMGEAASMKNWKVTRDGNLQKRPGVKEILHLGTTAYDMIFGVWTGFVGGEEYAMLVKGQVDSQTGLPTGTAKLFALTWDYNIVELGTFASGDVTTFNVHMFGFDDKLWILTGKEYYCFTPGIGGGTLAKVDGYVPLVATGVPPEGGTGNGTLLEQVNKLTGKRRMWISGNGTGTVFHLPDTTAITGVDYVKYLATNTDLTVNTDYTVNLTDKTVTFTGVTPAEAENNYEIGWHVADSDTDRSTAVSMSRSEFFNGSQDTRVFLYGDGSANAIYSDLDYDGKPRADYFPDLNQLTVGTANTPLTALVRQYSHMIAFKPDGTWSISFGQIYDANSNALPGFYITPVNKTIGHDSGANVQLVLNNPVTICGNDLYEWFPNKGGNLTNDERQAKRISDRVYETLHEFDTEEGGQNILRFVDTFDDNYNQEFYLFDPETDRALVWNYAADAWYYYEDFQMYKPFFIGGHLFNASKHCGIQLISSEITYDQKLLSEDPVAIDCRWESGSMSFGMDYQRKYAAMIWVGLKPETRSEVWVTVQTDKSSVYQEKVVGTALFGFDHIDFADWTFAINRKPQMRRLKIKAKKFVFYKLILMNKDANIDEGANADALDFSDVDFSDMSLAVEQKAFHGTSATVTSVDMRVRYTGFSK